jgi:uncharacterized membrane protein SpoIIM required for sporulation
MSPDMEFYLKMLGVFVASGLIIKYMNILQKRKQDEADKQFERTMQMIELRNKKYVPKDKK